MNQIVKLLDQNSFDVGEWSVSPGEGLLTRNGKTVRVEPKVMEVLVYLVSRQQEVVSREDIERDVWRGAIVGYDAITATVIKLRKALEDNARQPIIIATIPKRGYKLIASVRYHTALKADDIKQVQSQDITEADTPEISRTIIPEMSTGLNSVKSIWGPVLTIILLFTVFLIYKSHFPQPVDQSTEMPVIVNKQASVVILPLKNLSGDPQQEYFSDGITDDITTALSQIASLRVIARQSAERYKNIKTNLQDISRELGVNYVVEGSVQKQDNHLRIIAQLTDVEKDRVVWAEHFDRELKDLFSIQDEIARRISDNMLLTLSESENRYIPYRPTSSFEAYDAFLQGQQHYLNRSREDFELALDSYRRALAIDPKFGRAYGAMAVTLTMSYRMEWTDLSLQEASERALQLAQKAAELDKNTPQVFWSLGFVHLFRREFEEAEKAARRSITLSPNYADGYGLLAYINNWRGKAKEAEKDIRKAIALNPYHTYDYPWNLGFSYYIQGRYEEAAPLLNTALEKNATAYFPRLFLASTYVRLGRFEDANWEINEIYIQRPETTLSFLANTLPLEHTDQLQALLTDLTRAGLSE